MTTTTTTTTATTTATTPLRQSRIRNTTAVELDNARTALWEITLKRLDAEPADTLHPDIASLLAKHSVSGASFCVAVPGGDPQSLVFGDAVRGTRAVTPTCLFEIASLSKSVGTAFAIQCVRMRRLNNLPHSRTHPPTPTHTRAHTRTHRHTRAHTHTRTHRHRHRHTHTHPLAGTLLVVVSHSTLPPTPCSRPQGHRFDWCTQSGQKTSSSSTS
jgi:hypothetical protein